jgi:hypothetical protein
MIPLHNSLLLDHEYTVVEVTGVPADIYNWLTSTFGPAGSRWFYHQNKIYFRDERDYTWFELST